MIKAEIRIVDVHHLLTRFEELPKKALHAFEDALVIGVTEIRNKIIESMDSTPKTGRLYTWRGCNKGEKPDFCLWIGGVLVPCKKRDKPHIASAPGNPPAVDSTDLKRSIIMDVRLPGEIEVGSIITDPPYPIYLERGRTKGSIMAARPWLNVMVDRLLPDIEKNAVKAIQDAL